MLRWIGQHLHELPRLRHRGVTARCRIGEPQQMRAAGERPVLDQGRSDGGFSSILRPSQLARISRASRPWGDSA